MGYTIKKFFTEKLDVSIFPELLDDDEKIDLLINFDTTLLTSKLNDDFVFKMKYIVLSSNKPISLSWVGGCFLEEIEDFNTFDETTLLNDSNIRSFLDEMINTFSLFLNGRLPSIEQIVESYDNEN